MNGSPNPETGEYSLVAAVSAIYDAPAVRPARVGLPRSRGRLVDGVLTLTATEQMRVENPALQPSSDPPAAPPPCP